MRSMELYVPTGSIQRHASNLVSISATIAAKRQPARTSPSIALSCARRLFVRAATSARTCGPTLARWAFIVTAPRLPGRADSRPRSSSRFPLATSGLARQVAADVASFRVRQGDTRAAASSRAGGRLGRRQAGRPPYQLGIVEWGSQDSPCSEVTCRPAMCRPYRVSLERISKSIR